MEEAQEVVEHEGEESEDRKPWPARVQAGEFFAVSCEEKASDLRGEEVAQIEEWHKEQHLEGRVQEISGIVCPRAAIPPVSFAAENLFEAGENIAPAEGLLRYEQPGNN